MFFFLLKIETKAMTEGQIRQLSSLHSLKAQIFNPKSDLDLGKIDGNWEECPSLTEFWVERGFITSTQSCKGLSQHPFFCSILQSKILA